MDAVLKRGYAYLHDEVGATLLGTATAIGNIDVLELPRVTVIVGTSGPVNLLVAFCFDQALLERLYQDITADLHIAPFERQLFLIGTAAETVNIILGHATADLAADGCDVTLSPPVVLQEGRSLHRPKNAVFATLRMETNMGLLDIYFIGPPEMFDHELNVLS